MSIYFDTGLFLDQRLTRGMTPRACRGRPVSEFVLLYRDRQRLRGRGPRAITVSVDLSNTYLDWAAENFRLNGSPCAASIRARRLPLWLQEALSARSKPRFDLIYLDPPTFSNSKRMQGVLDIQRDHPG